MNPTRQNPTRRVVYAHPTTQGCGFATNSLAEGGTGPVAAAAHCVGNTGKAMLEDVVEEDTEDNKEVEGEEEVTTEVVVLTTPPIRTDLEIEMTASTATLGMRGVVAVDPAGDTAAGMAGGSN